MDDDIDDLLNEFESKFCSNNSKSASSKSVQNRPKIPVTSSDSAPSNFRSKNSSSDIDDILNELLDDEELKGSSRRKPATSNNKGKTNDSEKTSHIQGTKCFPAFIGGTKFPEGPSTSVNQRLCDKLRCTDCDFKVSRFDNMQWHSSTDYLFLRNNMPDYDRLRSKLVSKKGVCAYACQCKWKSAREMIDLQTEPDLKWVCGKH